jgi:hypothetical protein
MKNKELINDKKLRDEFSKEFRDKLNKVMQWYFKKNPEATGTNLTYDKDNNYGELIIRTEIIDFSYDIYLSLDNTAKI